MLYATLLLMVLWDTGWLTLTRFINETAGWHYIELKETSGKGAKDGGLDIACPEKVFPSEDRIQGMMSGTVDTIVFDLRQWPGIDLWIAQALRWNKSAGRIEYTTQSLDPTQYVAPINLVGECASILHHGMVVYHDKNGIRGR